MKKMKLSRSVKLILITVVMLISAIIKFKKEYLKKINNK